ncbi:hypothetical protein D3C74_415050 [compost metagenome]
MLCFRIPVVRIHSEGFQNKFIDESQFRIQKSINDIADNDHGNEIGQDHCALKELGGEFIFDLVKEKCQHHSQYRIDYQKTNVVQQCIPNDQPSVVRSKQKLKVVQSNPLAFPYSVCIIQVLEGQKNTKHRQIVID